MSVHEPVVARYLSEEYVEKNPSWDREDSPWKVRKLREVLETHGVRPRHIVDVGCGAGDVLVELKRSYPDASLAGFDIAPDAERFWGNLRNAGVTMTVGDFTRLPHQRADLVIALDVLEHLQDPYAFLVSIRNRADYFAFHFPLDLSALSVLRESPLLYVHDKVGHIHFFTRRLATTLLADCGYRVIEARYTDAALSAPRRSLKTRLAQLPRRLAYAIDRDWGARLLGGETLMVLATPADRPDA